MTPIRHAHSAGTQALDCTGGTGGTGNTNHTGNMPARTTTPVALRRLDTLAKARHRLTRAHQAHCPLTGGGEAQLVVREDVYPPNDESPGLPLSTRFGPAIAFDYASLLLACTGIDMTRPRKPAAQLALARYAFAALAPAFQHALGEPDVSATAAAALHDEPVFPIYLTVHLPSIRLPMRWRMTAAGVQALLDSDPWHPVAEPVSPPRWLTAIAAAIPVDVGEAILPLAECNTLSCGDVICLAPSAFDVTGRANLPIGQCALQLRWLDTHRCFEVENMTHAPCAAPQHPASGTVSASTDASIDPARIPIRLSFSIGTLGTTVGELAALRPGSLLELQRGMPPEVTIEANGSTIGSGELVELDGRLAVQITRWPQSCTARPAP
jgi:type III secretion protein Q